MGKTTTLKKNGQEGNSLVMRGSSVTKYPFKVAVKFEPARTESSYVHPSMRDLRRIKLLAPTFNTDRNHFTPTFTLP